MKMSEAEKEALRLCPECTVFLKYSRRHLHLPWDENRRILSIECSIWVDEMSESFTGPNWETAVMKMKNTLHLNLPQPWPDEEDRRPGLPELLEAVS
ncbi:MAG: hypothetical protein ACLFQG_01250 [Desulfovermiculus sp.]